MAESWVKPSDIVKKLSDHVSSSFVFPIKVRGTVILDKGYYKLTDGKAGITLNIEKALELPVGAEVEIEGVLGVNLFYKEDTAILYPAINVNSYKVLDEEKEREFQKRVSEVETLLRNRTHYGFWETFSRLLKEKKTVKVGLIHGNSAQVWQDFMSAFRSAAGEYADRIEFVRFESSLSDEGLARTIEKVANSGVHAVFLLRGGGSKEELARIGGFESIKAIIRADIPFYIAIGHSFDRMVSLMEKAADGNSATPSIAGQELGKLVRVVSENESLRDGAKRRQAKESNFVLELVVRLLIIGFLLFFGIKVMPYLFKEFVLKDFSERTETKIKNHQP
uniref:Exonuclease VII large subunit C-terminal domain-containing protein n=1 Tax=Thermocrinis ruber TaxID=75906 RepID=A0A7C5X3K0_9AQUI